MLEERFRLTPMDFGLDVLTAEQRDRRLQEAQRAPEILFWPRPYEFIRFGAMDVTKPY